MNLKYTIECKGDPKYIIDINSNIMKYDSYTFALPAGFKKYKFYGINFYYRISIRIYNHHSGIKIRQKDE